MKRRNKIIFNLNSLYSTLWIAVTGTDKFEYTINWAAVDRAWEEMNGSTPDETHKDFLQSVTSLCNEAGKRGAPLQDEIPWLD